MVFSASPSASPTLTQHHPDWPRLQPDFIHLCVPGCAGILLHMVNSFNKRWANMFPYYLFNNPGCCHCRVVVPTWLGCTQATWYGKGHLIKVLRQTLTISQICNKDYSTTLYLLTICAFSLSVLANMFGRKILNYVDNITTYSLSEWMSYNTYILGVLS